MSQSEAALDAHKSVLSAMAELQDSTGLGRRVEAQSSSDVNHLVVQTCSETSTKSSALKSGRIFIGSLCCRLARTS